MRPTLELLDLLDQVRELMRVERSLVRAEISERTSEIPSRLTAVVIGIVLLTVALVAVSLFLLRFGIPLDLAFPIIAVVAITASPLPLRLGVAGPKTLALSPRQEHIANLFVVWRAPTAVIGFGIALWTMSGVRNRASRGHVAALTPTFKRIVGIHSRLRYKCFSGASRS